MSYLLDALRKSEAQRRLGELPTLSTGTPYTTPAPGGSRRWLLSAVFALAVALGGFVMWRELVLPPPLAEESRSEHPLPLAGESRPELPPPRAGEGRGGGEPEVAAASGGPDAGDPPSSPPSRGSGAERESRLAEAEQRSSQAAERREVRRRLAEPEPPAAEIPAPEPGPAEADQEVAVVGQDVAEPGPEPAEGFTPDRREFIHQWELPASVRNELPELNVMAHIYSDNPENRFVLMNGRRYVEGDSLGKGVTLAKIRREGAVVDFREYRFLVE